MDYSSPDCTFLPLVADCARSGAFPFFDIFKPLGIRSTEKLPGGWGMMADDIVAGIYGAIIILLINVFYYYV